MKHLTLHNLPPPSTYNDLHPPRPTVRPRPDNPHHPNSQPTQQPRPTLTTTSTEPTCRQGLLGQLMLANSDAEEIVRDTSPECQWREQGSQGGSNGRGDLNESVGCSGGEVGGGGVVEGV